AHYAGGAGIEAEGAMRAAAAHGLDVRGSGGVHLDRSVEVGRRILVQLEVRARLRAEGGEPQRPLDRNTGKTGRIPLVEKRLKEPAEGVLGFACHRDIETRLPEHEWIVGTHFGSAHQDARARRAPFHFPGEVKAPLDVPEVERK